jgi:hypothetical protein
MNLQNHSNPILRHLSEFLFSNYQKSNLSRGVVN